jgi:hypothetical protein
MDNLLADSSQVIYIVMDLVFGSVRTLRQFAGVSLGQINYAKKGYEMKYLLICLLLVGCDKAYYHSSSAIAAENACKAVGSKAKEFRESLRRNAEQKDFYRVEVRCYGTQHLDVDARQYGGE